jgi:tetratricopeptide (TPR) repeat protein
MSSPTLNNLTARIPALALWLAGALLAAGCSHGARKEPPAAAHPVAAPAAAVTMPATATPAATGAAVPAAGTPAGAPAPVHPDVPPAARADFNRAVQQMRAGNLSEAEREFKQLALQYPQFAAPLVNVGLMQRKQGQLDKAEISLRAAVASESGSAVAWTELGVTQRMRGEFKDAAASYQKAIDADPLYAPAWRNLGVLQDLYLGDSAHALASFEEYKKLTGEEKPVSGWIADLRQRLGMPPVKKPEAAVPAPDNAAPGPAAAPAPGPQPPAAAAPKTGA